MRNVETIAIGNVPIAIGKRRKAIGKLPIAIGKRRKATGKLPIAIGKLPIGDRQAADRDRQ